MANGRIPKATRQEILSILQRKGQATVQELCQELGITTTGIRQQLVALERDGLASYQEIRRGVGRPRYVYSLSEGAESLFPRSYDALASGLIAGLKEMGGKRKLALILSKMAQARAASYRHRTEGKDLRARVAETVRILEETGTPADWEEAEEQYVIHVRSCPYPRVARHHPEVCNLEMQFIALLVQSHVKMAQWAFEGNEHCVCLVTPRKAD